MSTPQIALMRLNIFKLSVVSFALLFSLTNVRAQNEEARLLSTPRPEIPEAAKKTGIGGRVTVRVALDESGKVKELERVSGPDSVCPAVNYPDVVALREAARTAALKAKFAPATQDGKPVASTIYVNYDFKRTTMESEVLGVSGVKVVEEEKTKEQPKSDSGNVREMRLDRISPVGNTPLSTPRNTEEGDDKTISGGVLNGKAVNLPKPPYPPAARAVRAAGAVSVRTAMSILHRRRRATLCCDHRR